MEEQIVDDFIGQTSKDGKLKVIGVAGRYGSHLKYKVTCEICTPDTELFPDGYFTITKGHFLNDRKPCGCSESPKWTKEQVLINAKREGDKKCFIVHGFAEPFKGRDTKLDCECKIDGCKWNPPAGSVITCGKGCPDCGKRSRISKRTLPEDTALKSCIDICKQEGYTPVGFVDGYTNARNSYFHYICPKHGPHSIVYYSFVNRGSRCPSCAESGYDRNKPGRVYLTKWNNDNVSFLKFGITNFELNKRIKKQKGTSDLNHKVIFDFYFEDGNIPPLIESKIKQNFKAGFVDKTVFPDGFTETLSIDDLESVSIFMINQTSLMEV